MLDNFILADELFGKRFGWFASCVLVNNNLCIKLVSSLEVIRVLFFTIDFNLLSCET